MGGTVQPPPPPNKHTSDVGKNRTHVRVNRISRLDPRRSRPRVLRLTVKGGEGARDPPPGTSSLNELELCEKSERVNRYETKSIVPKLKVQGHPLVSKARSITQKSAKCFFAGK